MSPGSPEQNNKNFWHNHQAAEFSGVLGKKYPLKDFLTDMISTFIYFQFS